MEFKPRLKIYRGSNGKNTYDPETKEFRSYGHWCYAKPFRGVWVFNEYTYSHTTSGHQSEGRCFLREELGVKNWVSVNQYSSLTRGINLDWNYETLIKLEMRIKREHRKARRSELIEQVTTLRAQILVLRKLGGKTSIPVKTLKKQVMEDETKRLAEQREKSRAARLEYAKKRKALKEQFGDNLTNTDSVQV